MKEEKEVKNTYECIEVVMKHFKEIAMEFFYKDSILQGLAEVVFLETIKNAMEHGNNYDSEKTIKVSWEITDDCLILSVEDEGQGFTPIIPDELPSDDTLRGRGLYMIREFSDAVCFNGKEIRFGWS